MHLLATQGLALHAKLQVTHTLTIPRCLNMVLCRRCAPWPPWAFPHVQNCTRQESHPRSLTAYGPVVSLIVVGGPALSSCPTATTVNA
jgi:hypothetical protein